MKTIFLSFLMLCYVHLASAQCSLDVTNTTNLYIESMTVVFEDGTSEEYTIGQLGKYHFEFIQDIDYIMYYDTRCYIGSKVQVTVGQSQFIATLDDEARSFTSIIR